MRRKDHPSFPSAITCCFFSSLKTLLMPSEPIKAPLGVNVPDFAMAGFQLTLYGRIWVTPEVRRSQNFRRLPVSLLEKGLSLSVNLVPRAFNNHRNPQIREKRRMLRGARCVFRRFARALDVGLALAKRIDVVL